MRSYFSFLSILVCACVLVTPQAWAVGKTLSKMRDVDEREVVLNQKNWVTVVLYSNQATQSKTRAAGRSLYPLQGIKKFRVIVVVDLRRSLATWAPDYTVRRIRRSLDKEAKAIEPFYRKNGNFSDPRPNLSAIVDFEGKVCEELEWHEPSKKLGAILYDSGGREVKRWEDLKDYEDLLQAASDCLR